MEDEQVGPPGWDLPSSPAQNGRLDDIARQGAVGTLAHCVSVALEIRGAVDPDVLQSAVDHVIRRRPALRAVFRPGHDRHTITEPMTGPIRHVVVGGDTPAARWERAYALARAEAHQPFPVGHPPLLRATRFDVGERQLFALYMDQLAADAWSANLVADDLVAAADRFARGLPPAGDGPDRYPEVWRARADWLAGPAGEAAVARRRAALVGHRERWPLPLPRDPDRNGDMVEQTRELDPVTAAPFLHKVRTTGGSVFTATALAWGLAYPAERVALSTSFACRQNRAEEEAVGWFANRVTIPLPPFDGPFVGVARAMRGRLVTALNDQAAPYRLVTPDGAAGDRDGWTVSLLYLPKQLAGGSQTWMRIGGATAACRQVTVCPTGADLDLYVVEQPGGEATPGALGLTLGAISSRGGPDRPVLTELLDRWRDTIIQLGHSDWRAERSCRYAGAVE